MTSPQRAASGSEPKMSEGYDRVGFTGHVRTLKPTTAA
jgi:hypothetical protein